MSQPTDAELAALAAAFDVFTRRYKLAEALGPDKPLNELDKLVLFFVADHPGCGPTDAARFLNVAATTVSSATDRLAKRGLIDRRRPEEDRRAVALHLSPAGSARVEALRATYRSFHLRMLEPLSPDERSTFVGMLHKIVSDDS
jgi:DNA-binding MarR family transcriptional regulator